MKVVRLLFVRQFSSFLLGPPTEDESVGHVSRGEQKVQTASQKSPGTASAREGLIELGSCDRVPRNNGVEADKKRFFSYAGGNKRHFVLLCMTCLFSCFLRKI